jgi:amino acid transporter
LLSDDKRRPTFLRKTRRALQNPVKSRRSLESGQAQEGSVVVRTHVRGEHERIVVPREERGERRAQLDVELREIRWGADSRGAYLRVVPSRRRFKRVRSGHIEATREASTPVGGIERVLQAIKRVLLGNPFASSQIVHERLSKVKALAIFSSDALSSSAYATEEILLVLVLAGSGALHDALPISIVIAILLGIVTISYQQTVTYYPNGGGAYSVANENLGRFAGLLAAAALSIGYILTVSVSVAAGVAAVTSAVPDLHDARVPIGVVVIALLTLANLRGLREAGTLFAIPTYYFILAMTGLIAYGVFQVAFGDAPGSVTKSAEPLEEVPPEQALGLLLILRAFAAGCAGLTGVEAISNGVPAFKPPESQNARITLAWMAGILAFFLIGVTFLATRYGIVPVEGETGISALGREVLGKNAMYYGLQVGTALVLFLAANTSYAGFPLMAAILSQDKFLPRQFAFRGDKLAYSHGIIALALFAAILLVVFQGSVTRLIPLYALGVFISFTLSQSGMVRYLTHLKGVGWQRAVLISGVGAVATLVVAVIVGITRFIDGAWISIVMMAALMGVFTLIRRHYDWVERKIAIDESDLASGIVSASPVDAAGRAEHIVVPVDGINKVTMGAIAMARALSSRVTAVHLTDSNEGAATFRESWERLIPDVPLLIIESPYRAFSAPMVAYVDSLRQAEPDRRITVVLPAFKAHHWYERILHNQAIRNLKPFLDDLPEVRVVEFDYDVSRNGEKPAAPPSA